ncbi:MAG: RCC1 domain-containing protein [Thermoleophilia bacterium]
MKKRLGRAGLALGLVLCAFVALPTAAGAAGGVSGWGYNDYGVLGIGTTGGTYRTPVDVQGLGFAAAVDAGGEHSLALKPDGTVWAWGANKYYGQLGNGGSVDSATPLQVPGLGDVIAVSAGRWHSLALRSDGTVWAWGYNWNGELGVGTLDSVVRAPVQVPGLSEVTAISAGGRHSLALKSDGTVWAWGFNYYGQLGDGTADQRRAPVNVRGIGPVAAISAGGGHSLALRPDGTVWAWGANNVGQVGDGSGWYDHYEPNQVVNLTNVTSISAGSAHSLALRDDGSVWAWGMNREGQLGDGIVVDGTTLIKSFNPVRALVTGAVAVAGGSEHSLALLLDGTVKAWGSNYFGQLGDGSTSLRTSTPVSVQGLSMVEAIAGGMNHSFAIVSPGDTEAPVITLSSDTLLLPVGATGFADYNPSVTAVDNLDPSPTLSWSPAGPLSVGVHTVVFTATDSSGNIATASQLVVVYDVGGGFVTGAGWIDSPPGAYAPDPSLGGRAIFGFVSKYTTGTSTPTGNTSFQFQAAGLRFQSTSYEWLVVTRAGSYAQFSGSGTINGAGSYKFMLWAGDGATDTLRIKIWNSVGDTESVVYDNGADKPIGAGSIVVQ